MTTVPRETQGCKTCGGAPAEGREFCGDCLNGSNPYAGAGGHTKRQGGRVGQMFAQSPPHIELPSVKECKGIRGCG